MYPNNLKRTKRVRQCRTKRETMQELQECFEKELTLPLKGNVIVIQDIQ